MFVIVTAIIASPVTTVLNVFVIIAVKTKLRLKTMSNIAIGCLAVTDALNRIFGLPIFIAARILTVTADIKRFLHSEKPVPECHLNVVWSNSASSGLDEP